MTKAESLLFALFVVCCFVVMAFIYRQQSTWRAEQVPRVVYLGHDQSKPCKNKHYLIFVAGNVTYLAPECQVDEGGEGKR